MQKFEFSNNQFYPTSSELNAQLIIATFNEVQKLALSQAIIEAIQYHQTSTYHDTYLIEYSDFFLFNLTIKNHLEPANNDKIILIKTKQKSFLFTHSQNEGAQNFIVSINEGLQHLASFNDPILLIPYLLGRYDLTTDRAYLNNLEHEILELELAIDEASINPQEKILLLRKTLSSYKHHYLSLLSFLEDFFENPRIQNNTTLIKTYKQFFNQVDRLSKTTQRLSEHLNQINDHYRATLELNLNQTMKTLTILSAIFLPLTLIAGWYGMNFVNMPELQIKYGYLYVIILSICIIVLMLYYFKKKGFWD